MRISDWSSDVCSSDLQQIADFFPGQIVELVIEGVPQPLGVSLRLGRLFHAADLECAGNRFGLGDTQQVDIVPDDIDAFYRQPVQLFGVFDPRAPGYLRKTGRVAGADTTAVSSRRAPGYFFGFKPHNALPHHPPTPPPRQ